MTLPKSARKIHVNGKDYRWKAGRLKREDGILYANVTIELPDGSIKTFEECMGTQEQGVMYPIIPDTVRNLITMHNL